jgi:hypothetical protein
VTIAVRVSATVTGHRRRGVREHDLVLALPPGEVTARQLIEAAVAAEVSAFQARAEEASLIRVLTPAGHRAPPARGAVCIIPVGSQYRGRLFLPFADDDPKTAEVVAKVLLLARDHEIKDPTILEQLRS